MVKAEDLGHRRRRLHRQPSRRSDHPRRSGPCWSSSIISSWETGQPGRCAAGVPRSEALSPGCLRPRGDAPARHLAEDRGRLRPGRDPAAHLPAAIRPGRSRPMSASRRRSASWRAGASARSCTAPPPKRMARPLLPMDEGHPLLPTTPYAASKSAADQVVLSVPPPSASMPSSCGPSTTSGRARTPAPTPGIIPIVINRVRQGEPVMIHGDGCQTRDFIFVPHTADAFVRVYDAAGTRAARSSTSPPATRPRSVELVRDAAGRARRARPSGRPHAAAARRRATPLRRRRLFHELIGFEPPALAPRTWPRRSTGIWKAGICAAERPVRR